MHKQIAKRANEKNQSSTDLYVASLHTIREACDIQLNEGQRRNERGENIREIGLGWKLAWNISELTDPVAGFDPEAKESNESNQFQWQERQSDAICTISCHRKEDR